MKRRMIALGLAVGLSSFVASAGAAIINGDFEQPANANDAANTFPGWTEQAGGPSTNGLVASIHPGLGPNGGTQAAQLSKQPGGVFFQNVTLDSKWSLEFDFAVFGTGRSLQLFLPETGTSNRINLVVTNTNVDVYDQANAKFQTAVSNGVDVSADNDIKVNHIKIVGDYSVAEPYYKVIVTDSEGVTRESAELRFWQGGAASQGATINSIRFDTNNLGTNSYPVLDNVSIPEPTTAALSAGLASGMLLRRGRTSR